MMKRGTGGVGGTGGGIGEGSGFPYVGGTDSKPSREERRAARKKAKKARGTGALDYSNLQMEGAGKPVGAEYGTAEGMSYATASFQLRGLQGAPTTDPDRPAVRPMAPVESMQDTNACHKIPVVPKASSLFSNAGTPSYFGAGGDDSEEEGYAGFTRMIHDEDEFQLGPRPTVRATMDTAEGTGLPEPNLRDSWKPMAPAASYTAYLKELPSSVAAVPGWAADVRGGRRAAGPLESAASDDELLDMRGVATQQKEEVERREDRISAAAPKEDRDALLARIDHLMSRLDGMEKKRKQDSQTEILMFVGTGLFLLTTFHLVSCRR